MAKIIDIEAELDGDKELELTIDGWEGADWLYLNAEHLAKIAAAFGYALTPLPTPETDNGR